MGFLIKTINNDQNFPKTLQGFKNELLKKFKEFYDIKHFVNINYKFSKPDLKDKSLVELTKHFELIEKQAHDSGFDADMALNLHHHFNEKFSIYEKYKNSLYWDFK